MLYCDANAGIPATPAALAAYREAAALAGNPSSQHSAGRAAAQRLRHDRALVAAFVGADADEIVFTSGGTESDALALLGTLGGIASPALEGATPPHVVSTTIEHAAVRTTLEQLAAQGRIALSLVQADRDGKISAADIAAALRPNTKLISVIAASNETGVLQPIAEIARLVATHPALLHTDAVQAAGRLPIDVRQLGVDLLSLSGHKVGSVAGVGALYVRSGVALSPLLTGGGQELGRRATTENVAGIASFAAALQGAADLAAQQGLAELRERFERAVVTGLPDGAVAVIGGGAPRLANTSLLRFAGVEGEAVMMALDVRGFAVSTGSACSSGSVDPSPILLGMGLSRSEARQSVRFSFPAGITARDIDRLSAALIDVIQQARALAP